MQLPLAAALVQTGVPSRQLVRGDFATEMDLSNDEKTVNPYGLPLVSMTFPDEEIESTGIDPAFHFMRNSWENFTQTDHLRDVAIDNTQVRYHQNISDVFGPNETQWEYISRNGFVVMDFERRIKTFEDAYEFYWKKDLPVFITTDTILNTFHLLYMEFLKRAENETLRFTLENMTSDLLQESQRIYDEIEDPIVKDGMRDVVVFFGVPAVLIGTNDSIPDYAQEDVYEFVRKVLEANVVEAYPGQDYTQYKPRGHYAGNPYLERYFRTMMWYGRKSYDMEATSDVLRACLVTFVTMSHEAAQLRWDKMFEITRRLIGESDSLNHRDIAKAVEEAVGSLDIGLLEDPSNLVRIKEELEKDKYIRQRILSAVVYITRSEEPYVFPKIFQFIGQRYVPDSEIIQNVIYDRVPLYKGERRGLPSSLDVMAAMGSPRAVQDLQSELEKYNYTEQLKDAWASVQAKNDEYWNQSVYFGVLRSYEELVSDSEGEEYPDFMRTAAWADEKLNTALGSWTELRHDNILYAKEAYSGTVCSTPEGFVEPYPAFYSRMENLSIMMQHLLRAEFNPRTKVFPTFTSVFREFAIINQKLAVISTKELQGTPLTQDEVVFIRTIYRQLWGICDPPPGWLPTLLMRAGIQEKDQDTRIVADVATDPGWPYPPSPPKVLHVATGYVRTVIVATEDQNGNLTFYVGPVYSFYEFPLEGFQRLTDGEWKRLLNSEDRLPDPFWTETFFP